MKKLPEYAYWLAAVKEDGGVLHLYGSDTEPTQEMAESLAYELSHDPQFGLTHLVPGSDYQIMDIDVTNMDIDFSDQDIVEREDITLDHKEIAGITGDFYDYKVEITKK